MDGPSLVPGYQSMVKSFKLQAFTNQGTSMGREAAGRKPQAGLDKA